MPEAYCFPAKRQGWAALIAFVCLVTAGAWLFPPRTCLICHIGYVVALSIILFIVCWMKGERPRWRWDEADQ
jgi:hypothetical protein